MRRFEAAYVKCVKSKSFFGFERRYSVTQMFCDILFNNISSKGPVAANNMLHNA